MAAEHSRLEMTTRWGKSARFTYLKHSEGSEKLAVLFPGQAYNLDAPLMWYATKSAFAAGCDVLGVEYGFQANRSSIEQGDIPDVSAEVADSLEQFFHVTPYHINNGSSSQKAWGRPFQTSPYNNSPSLCETMSI